MSDTLLLVLLPIAGWIGWSLASRTSAWRHRKNGRDINDRYFQGLNYLLNEQPDKAIEVFMELAEVNRETVETHLALGSLFRKRGEVDRAIRLHQNIISKQGLDASQRTQALLELGEDYMRAGLFDRAERLFSDLLDRDDLAPSALRSLLDIYQQEKDWQQALDVAGQLEKVSDINLSEMKSHFCCELAQLDIQNAQPEAARKHLRQARRFFPQGVRSRFILADINLSQSDYAEALKAYEEIAELNIDYLPDMLEPYLQCAQQAGTLEQAKEKVVGWSENYDGISLILTRTEMLEADQGIKEAASYLAQSLSEKPSVKGLDKLIELKLRGGPEVGSSDEILRAVAQRLLSRQPSHQCTNCGFSGHTHHWQCPSCRQWGGTRTVRGVLGE
jgi:lipopolysaccharide biosynthesis regulator YciM